MNAPKVSLLAPPHLHRVTNDASLAYYFDVAMYWADALDPFHCPEALSAACTEMSIGPLRDRYHRERRTRIQVYQPLPGWFDLAREQLRPFARLHPYYAEPARDFVCRSPEMAQMIHAAFLGAAWVRYCRTPVESDNGTHYWARKHRTGLVTYSDQLYRHAQDLDPLYCCHTEFRLRSASDLRAAGLWTIEDFCRFQHNEFWESAVTFYALPHQKTAIGRLADVSRLRTSATHRNWVDAATTTGHFVFQNFGRVHPVVKSRIPTISTEEWLRSIDQARADRY